MFQVLGSLGVTGGHRLLEQGAGLFRIAVHHVAHAPQVVGTKVGVALERVQRLGVLFGLQQVDGFVERQEFGIGLRLVEHLDVSRVAKLREEVLLHIVIGLATVELHEKSQATHFLLGVPHRSSVDDVQHLLPGVHVAVCNEPAQKSPRLLVVFHEKVGGGKPIPIDVRFISATRQNLAEMVERGEFREDLYYRLNVVNIETLPLREHPTDILLYANHVLNALNAKYKTGHLLSDRVKYLLMCYKWPGNVRELINVITSAYATCDSYVIEEMDLPGRLVSGTAGNSVSQMKLSEMMNLHEAAIIRDALRRNNQNCKKTAEELGIDRSLLYRKMRKAGIAIHREIK